MRRFFAFLLWFSTCTQPSRVVVESPAETLRASLVGRVVLPAHTFAQGPAAGTHLAPGAGGPFASQPVQGFSSLTALGDGGFVTVCDNGFGVPETSSDFLLRAYALTADFDAGTLRASELFTLSDPRRLVPWPIVHAFTAERLLTGADFDPESMVPAPDGTFWLGDEHGPFLLHVDAHGRLIDPPFPLTLDGGAWHGPDHPQLRRNLILRSMEALRAHAHARDAGTPIASPDHRWLESREQVEQLHAAGFRVIPWTVNEPERMEELVAWGVDGLITDRPDLAGAARDAGIDLQGHRGARGLAPESTRASFLAAMRAGATTLELDLTATADGRPIVWHDEVVGPPKCHGTAERDLIAPRTRLADLRRAAVCNGTLPQFPAQRVEPGAANYRLLTLEDVLALGPPLNVETKVHGTGAPFDDAAELSRYVARTVASADAGTRVTLQSFDWRALTTAHAEAPWLQTVALFGRDSATASDEARAGLPWPQATAAPNVSRSAGFENLALSADGRVLYAMLEKPVDASRECLAFAFDLATGRFTHLAFRFPLDARAAAVGDLTLIDANQGYALERDDSERRLDGFKRLVRFTLPEKPGGLVHKETAADLLDLATADGGRFAFPFWTIEGVAVLPDGRVAIVNDNNFPFGRGRDEGHPDESELIVIEPR
ncbi:MAG: esterase-like activity of phytase family protein [Myxococcota bacterium]